MIGQKPEEEVADIERERQDENKGEEKENSEKRGHEFWAGQTSGMRGRHVYLKTAPWT